MKREARASLQRAEELRQSGELPAAIAELERVVALEPNSRGARLALGRAWLDAGDAERAIVILSPLTKMRSAYRGAAEEKLKQAEQLRDLRRSPPGYVRHLFDQFSHHYDRQMVEDLAYSAPGILRRLADLLGCASSPVDILDLGCGTGLAGEVFRPLAKRLDGVDLSPQMVAQAKRKAIYDELTVADVESFLAEQRRDYDLLIAADMLVYFGDLAAVFRGAKLRLRPGGWFLFTVEKHNGRGFVLGPKRRYQHSTDYIRETAMEARLDCMGLIDCVPRKDAGEPVEASAVALHNE
jgi:predicted TPR repeat methyltransferase